MAKPLVALSNGRLEATVENADGTRTFRWVQDTPVPNYLLTVDVGAFTKVPLAAAHLPGRDLPLSVWGEAGSESALALTFGKTPEMVEFFSQRFGYAYLKGALVLHMLRRIVGDEDFYRTLAWYLHRNEFRSVESSDLLAAFKATTGRNLTWFFDDWIVGGGGHPSFEVSYQWVPERKQVDLTVKQVQADLTFENAFRLPMEVEIVTAAGTKTHTIEVDGWTTHLALPADSKPLAVVFDKGGWLVADVRFDRSLDEWLYQLAHGGLAEQLRAARQLGQEFRHRREAVSALVDELADKNAHWGLRQEAARGLGLIGDESAAKALIGALRDPDRRVRRGVAVALAGGAGGRETDEALKAAVTGDPAEDVVAATAASLGKRQASGAREFLAAQVERGSRWWDVIRAGALTGLSEFEDASMVATFARHVDATENIDVRLAALKGWARAAPEDRALAGRLRDFTRDPNRSMQLAVIDLLAGLHRSEDAGFFRDLSGHPDAGISQAARDAAEAIEAFKVRSQP
ncbi:MAG: HEAT repeat domain-containing protein [Vicinamibacteria bacterium]|nr:HEAT repeat domain-containing protein [Vicinamibacteria bacterium]